MKGLIPLTLLVPFCPIGKMATLVFEWEELYGDSWEGSARRAGRGGRLQERVLDQFNGSPLSVSTIAIKGYTKQKINMACIHLTDEGKLQRVGRGVYRRV